MPFVVLKHYFGWRWMRENHFAFFLMLDFRAFGERDKTWLLFWVTRELEIIHMNKKELDDTERRFLTNKYAALKCGGPRGGLSGMWVGGNVLYSLFHCIRQRICLWSFGICGLLAPFSLESLHCDSPWPSLDERRSFSVCCTSPCASQGELIYIWSLIPLQSCIAWCFGQGQNAYTVIVP